MTAGLLARAELTTIDPAGGLLSRAEMTVPTVWYGRLARAELTAPAAITGSAGADFTAEPYHAATLTGSESGLQLPAKGFAWRQVSGPAVALSGDTTRTATFSAPGTLAGTVLVFGYTATGQNDTPSVEDTVTVTVLPVTERAVMNGVEVPIQLLQVS